MIIIIIVIMITKCEYFENILLIINIIFLNIYYKTNIKNKQTNKQTKKKQTNKKKIIKVVHIQFVPTDHYTEVDLSV